MKPTITAFLVLLLPLFALAEDRLPSPDYHPLPSDPEWLVEVEGVAIAKNNDATMPRF